MHRKPIPKASWWWGKGAKAPLAPPPSSEINPAHYMDVDEVQFSTLLIKCVLLLGGVQIFLDPTCNKYCDLIG